MESKHIRNNAIYQLYGIDIILDDNFKPWLLEVNYGPDLGSIDLTDLNDQERERLNNIFLIYGQIVNRINLNNNRNHLNN